jgi:drug/metabolite transporter (DMT)-like permease
MEKLEKYIKISYTLAFVLIMAGIVLVAIFEDYQQSGISLINIGAIILFVTFIRAKRYRNGPVKDERTIKIGAYGLSYSWLITFILIALLFWVEEFGISQMTVKQILAVLMFTMVVTAKGIQWYLFRKGDIESSGK